MCSLLQRLWGFQQGRDSVFPAAEFVENITQAAEELRIPDDEDLNGAAMALIRLQDTYRLSTAGGPYDRRGSQRTVQRKASHGVFQLNRDRRYRLVPSHYSILDVILLEILS